jgi:hypothetical protein
VAVPSKIIAPGATNGVRPPKHTPAKDPRFETYRSEIFAFWRGQNPAGESCPWIMPDRRALADFLDGAPSMKLAQFKALLRTRADSEINPAAPPRAWLRDLMEYSAGPLDRYKKQLRPRRSI